MPNNICDSLRTRGLRGGTRSRGTVVFHFYFSRMFDLAAGSSCHNPRDIGIHLWLGRLRARAHGAIILVFIGAVSAFVVATYALGYATLAPGRVTFHRVLGAIALYLNIGLMFGAIYRMIWYFIPSSLTNIPGDAGWPAYGQILYFSFVTLTSTGFGDIVPVHPVIRMLVNVEAIIGQLYPPTLLARLITLELRGARRAVLKKTPA